MQESTGSYLALRSSPGPKTGCSDRPVCPRFFQQSVAILTRSEDRVQPERQAHQLQAALAVAILTRSEDRVQRRPRWPAADGSGGVAILTRSEDRVQLLSAISPFAWAI